MVFLEISFDIGKVFKYLVMHTYNIRMFGFKGISLISCR